MGKEEEVLTNKKLAVQKSRYRASQRKKSAERKQVTARYNQGIQNIEA